MKLNQDLLVALEKLLADPCRPVHKAVGGALSGYTCLHAKEDIDKAFAAVAKAKQALIDLN